MKQSVQVLDRAFALVRCLGEAAGAVLGCGELAERTGIPKPTCSRILASLVSEGWVDQDGPRGGFRLGPALHHLALTHPWGGPLVDAALPIADSLAERIYCKVVVAVLRGHRRLTVVETGPGGQASPALRESDDCYTTAGGRMLLALLPDRRQRAALEELGHPGLRWPAAAKLPKTAQALRAIARDRRSIKGEGRWALAVGQEVPGHGLISIGCNSDAVPDVDSVESWTAALHEGLGRLAERLGDCSELL